MGKAFTDQISENRHSQAANDPQDRDMGEQIGAYMIYAHQYYGNELQLIAVDSFLQADAAPFVSDEEKVLATL